MTDSHALDSGPSVAPSRIALVSARLFVGLIVLVCAEGLSGASIRTGVWNPWTILVTYWLYFAHFFFFTTLAIHTRKTSLPALYLWGVLFGLYETWITKVVWAGFEGNGHFALGKIGPYGFAEISMVFFFHPMMAFLLPLCVLTVVSPGCRQAFPILSFLTGMSRKAQLLRIYIAVASVTFMSFLSGGPINIAVNVAIVVAAGWVLYRYGSSALVGSSAETLLALRPKGFAVTCAYLALLYGVTYFNLRAEVLPTAGVQCATFIFYAVAIAALMRAPLAVPRLVAPIRLAERSRGIRMVIAIAVCAFALSFFAGSPVLAIAAVPHFVLWTLLGFALFGYAVVYCLFNRSDGRDGAAVLIR